MAKEESKVSVEIHKRIKTSLKSLHEKYSECEGFYIPRIATNAGTDTRSAKHHLEILEENGFGRFLDPDKKVFGLQIMEEKK